MAIFALEPSASFTPPALLITSAAASIAASLLTPKERTGPVFAPKPAILMVFSCASTGVAPRAHTANAAETARAIFFT